MQIAWFALTLPLPVVKAGRILCFSPLSSQLLTRDAVNNCPAAEFNLDCHIPLMNFPAENGPAKGLREGGDSFRACEIAKALYLLPAVDWKEKKNHLSILYLSVT